MRRYPVPRPAAGRPAPPRHQPHRAPARPGRARRLPAGGGDLRVWMPPRRQAFLGRVVDEVAGAVVCPASDAAVRTPRARMEMRRSRPNRKRALEALEGSTGWRDLVS
jgi:hypothetical protein